MDPLQNVRDTAKYVTSSAQFVQLNQAGVEKIASVIAKDVWQRLSSIETGAVSYQGPNIDQVVSNDGFVESLLIEWDKDMVHFRSERDPELTAQYILVLSALNFCFWPGCTTTDAQQRQPVPLQQQQVQQPVQQVLQQQQQQQQPVQQPVQQPPPVQQILSQQQPPVHVASGLKSALIVHEFEYNDLASCLKDVIKQNPFAFEAQTLQNCSEETLFQWFKKRQVPLAAERARLLREIGCELLQKHNGLASAMIAQAKKSASRLVSIVTAGFPGFRDQCIDPCTGRQLFFFKRAQIFVADIWGCFQGKGLGEFQDIHKLTMFADYRVPQILRHLGILEYQQPLIEMIDQCKLMACGSQPEIEIRATTIEAVERLREVLEKSHRIRAKSVEIDWWLWQKGEAEKDSIPPHHRTMTVFY